MVRVITAVHAANAIKSSFVDDALEILPQACKFKDNAPIDLEILQSSFDEEKLSSPLIAANNGLVNSIIQAYCQHYHLQLRPEDIWVAILSQISIYINANAEALRDKFVEHEGKKELKIVYQCHPRYCMDFSIFAREMTSLLHENITDKDFRDWVMPGFSTTTVKDHVVAAILMMGSMQKYFAFTCCLMCGIPSVTLLGEKADYEKILQKLDFLSSLGEEPKKFAAVLRPVMSRFVRTFDDPADPAIVHFWSRIAHKNSGSGSSIYSGWVTAFCFWDDEGKCLRGDDEDDYDESQGTKDDDLGEVSVGKTDLRYHSPSYLSLDGVKYHTVDSKSIPPGWCKVPVKVDDNGIEVDTEMVAGSVGMVCSSSGLENVDGNVCLDTVQPETGWWIYEV